MIGFHLFYTINNLKREDKKTRKPAVVSRETITTRTEKGYEGKPEKRRGVDVIHFKDGKIIEKLTYCKTRIEINGQRHNLTP